MLPPQARAARSSWRHRRAGACACAASWPSVSAQLPRLSPATSLSCRPALPWQPPGCGWRGLHPADGGAEHAGGCDCNRPHRLRLQCNTRAAAGCWACCRPHLSCSCLAAAAVGILGRRFRVFLLLLPVEQLPHLPTHRCTGWADAGARGFWTKAQQHAERGQRCCIATRSPAGLKHRGTACRGHPAGGLACMDESRAQHARYDVQQRWLRRLRDAGGRGGRPLGRSDMPRSRRGAQRWRAQGEAAPLALRSPTWKTFITTIVVTSPAA